MLTATVANFSMGKDPNKAALQPSDFFPSLKDTSEDEEEMSIEAMWEVFNHAAKKGR